MYTSGDGSTFVAWCGLLVNTANLELQADYTRYAGVQLASTLTVPLAKVLNVWQHQCCHLLTLQAIDALQQVLC